MEDLQQPAVGFIMQMRKLELPEGDTKRLFSDKKKMEQVLLGLGTFLKNNHTAQDDVIAEVIASRLKLGKSGVPFLLREIAAGNGRISNARLLMDALNYPEENFFAHIEQALERVVHEKRLQLSQDSAGASTGEMEQPPVDANKPPRYEVKLDDLDKRIRREAADNDRFHHVVSDAQIRREAREGYPEFDALPPDTEFHQSEQSTERFQYQQKVAFLKEAEGYLKLARTVRENYDKTLGAETQRNHGTER